MNLVELKLPNQKLDKGEAALERPGAPDYLVARARVLDGIEATIEEFTLEFSVATDVALFVALVRVIERTRSLIVRVDEGLKPGQSKQIGDLRLRRRPYVRSAAKLISAVEVHIRLLQDIRRLQDSKVSCAESILALPSSLGGIELALDDHQSCAERLLAGTT